MKTIKLIAVAFAALAAVSCVKDNMGGADSKTYQASFTDRLPDAKATISVGQEESLVSWETSDRVGIMYGASNLEYKADKAGNTSSLSAVSASADASEVWALLPYDASASLSDGVISTTLPAEQKAGASFHHLAVAHSTTDVLSFVNVCGLVRVKVTTEGITKVVFAGKGGEKVAGDIDITVTTAQASEGTSESVALVADDESIPVGDYFLAVLPQTFQSGFTVTAYKGETAVQTKDIAGSVTLERCGIIAGTIREVTISAISSTVLTKGETVKITGTGFSTTAADNVVKIGNISCSVTAASATELSVTVPDGLSKSTDYKFSVTVKGTSTVDSPLFRYYYLPTYKATTVCGTSGSAGLIEGIGTAAKIQSPYFIGEGQDGQLWFTCAHKTNDAICKFDYANTLNMTIFVAAADVPDESYPYGGAFDPSGNLHIALKGKQTDLGEVTATGNFSTYYFYDFKQITDKGFSPMDICFDKNGVKYVAERNSQMIVVGNGTEVKPINLDFRPIALTPDAAGKYIYIGTDSKFKIYRMDIATKEIVPVAGNGTKPVNGSASGHGTAGNPLSAVVGNVTGIYCDHSDGYIYYLDQQYCNMFVLVPGVGDDASKGIIKKVYGTLFNDAFLGNTGGQLTKASDGNFYVTCNAKHKIAKIHL